MIDVGFLEQLKRRRIEVRPETIRLTPTGAVFADGNEEAFDAIVAATGFDTGLADLLEVPGAVDDRGLPVFPSGQETPQPGLYVIGYEESIAGHLYRAHKDSLRLAKDVERYLDGAGVPTSASTSSA